MLAVGILVVCGVARAMFTTLTNRAGDLPSVDAGSGNNNASGVNGADMNILIVGSDSREGYSNEQLAQLSTQYAGSGTNTDTRSC